MKRLILLELCLLFLATSFQGDRLTGWVQQTIPRQDLPVMDLQFLDTLTGFMVSTKPAVDTAFIFKTTDGGNNWSTSFFDSLYLVCMDMVDKNVGYCGGAKVGSGILKKTTNGGDNWFTVSSIPYMIIEDVKFINKDTGWVCGTAPLNGGLWRTIDGGLTWQMQMNYVPAPSKIFFANSNTGWVIGNSGDMLFKTTNCGINWFECYSPATTIKNVFFINSDLGWITSYVSSGQNGLLKSTNGGNNWFGVNNVYPSGDSKVFFMDSLHGWAGSGQSKIIITKDGYNWGYQTTPGFNHYFVHFVDTIHGWAGGGGFDIIHTSDGGGTITYTGIKRNGDFIPSFELGQNYPNPFNASTRIKFSILKSCYLDLKIFNIKGQEVASLISGLGYKPGEYEFYFDAGKHSLSSGVYFYYMKGATTDNKEIFLDTKRMLMIK